MEANIETLTLSQKRQHYEKLASYGTPDIRDITEKIILARNILMVHEKRYHLKYRQFVPKAMVFTGTDEKTILEALSNTKKRAKFGDVENLKSLKRLSDFDNIDFLRDIITKLYVEQLVVPTVKHITDSIQDSAYDTDKLKVDLRNLGYTWKRLPGTTAGVIVENPEQLHMRINYLRKIIEHRKNGRFIVYLRYDHNGIYSKLGILEEEGRYGRFQDNAIAVLPHVGLLNRTSYSSNDPQLVKWFDAIVLPTLPKSCVLVVDLNTAVREFMFKTPTFGCPKSELINWLEAENIPHDPTWHRAELYKLVEKYKINKGNEERRALEELSKISGHDILILPKACSPLNYYRGILESQIEKIEQMGWVEQETKLIQRELKTYEDSIKYEEIIDKIFTMATYGHVKEISSQLETYSAKLNDGVFASLKKCFNC